MQSLEMDKQEAARFSVPIITMGDYHEVRASSRLCCKASKVPEGSA